MSGLGIFSEIEHQAFAHEGVEELVEKTGQAGFFHDIPG